MLIKCFVVVLITAIVLSFFSGCNLVGSLTSTDTPEPVTGTISVGQKTQVVASTIGVTGGTISVTGGSPVDGLEVTVPQGSYGTPLQFSVSYASIEKHTFGDAFNPLTPLIMVENGGEYSEEIMTVTIPVNVPEGHFAMGFLYDAETNTLEGLPTIASADNSITVATRHFSSIVISAISEAGLKKDIDSGFRPGADDWQFVNRGSYIAPGGHCAGQSITAMWYYCTQPDGPGKSLYNLYDNNGNLPATPTFQYDDSLGYRFASVIQNDSAWESISRKFTKNVLADSDDATWKMFAYAMQLTGEPQLVEIWNTTVGGGHAMVVYRVANGNLYIADPNYPANTDRRIEFANGEFKPYNSGANADEIAAGKGKAYDRIVYVAKTAIIDWGKIASRWQEVKSQTIGDDKFPAYYSAYKVTYLGPSGYDFFELKDGLVTSSDRMEIYVNTDTAYFNIINRSVFRDQQTLLPDSNRGYALNPGQNRIGVLITGEVNGIEKYIDFHYFNIISTVLVISPASLTGQTGQSYSFTVDNGISASGTRYEWYLNGILLKDETADTISHSFDSPGKYTLTVSQIDGAGKELGTAGASINIEETALTSATGIFATLQQMKFIEGRLGGEFTFKIWQGGTSSDDGEINAEERRDTNVGAFPIKRTPITWSGTTFTGKLQVNDNNPLNPITCEVNGSVSPDGRTINTLNYVYEEHSYTEAGKIDVSYSDYTVRRIQLKNLPLDIENDTVIGFMTGNTVKENIVLIDAQQLSYKDGVLISSIIYLSTDWTATGTFSTMDGTVDRAPTINMSFTR